MFFFQIPSASMLNLKKVIIPLTYILPPFLISHSRKLVCLWSEKLWSFRGVCLKPYQRSAWVIFLDKNVVTLYLCFHCVTIMRLFIMLVIVVDFIDVNRLRHHLIINFEDINFFHVRSYRFGHLPRYLGYLSTYPWTLSIRLQTKQPHVIIQTFSPTPPSYHHILTGHTQSSPLSRSRRPSHSNPPRHSTLVHFEHPKYFTKPHSTTIHNDNPHINIITTLRPFRSSRSSTSIAHFSIPCQHIQDKSTTMLLSVYMMMQVSKFQHFICFNLNFSLQYWFDRTHNQTSSELGINILL